GYGRASNFSYSATTDGRVRTTFALVKPAALSSGLLMNPSTPYRASRDKTAASKNKAPRCTALMEEKVKNSASARCTSSIIKMNTGITIATSLVNIASVAVITLQTSHDLLEPCSSKYLQ